MGFSASYTLVLSARDDLKYCLTLVLRFILSAYALSHLRPEFIDFSFCDIFDIASRHTYRTCYGLPQRLAYVRLASPRFKFKPTFIFIFGQYSSSTNFSRFQPSASHASKHYAAY